MLARQQIITQCCDSYNIDIYPTVSLKNWEQELCYSRQVFAGLLVCTFAPFAAEKIIQLGATKGSWDSYFSAVLGLIINTTNSVSFYHTVSW